MPLTFIIISIISAILITSISYDYNTENIEYDLFRLADESNIRLANHFDFLFNQYLNSIEQLLNDEQVLNWYSDDNFSIEPQIDSIQNILGIYKNNSNGIKGIHLVKSSGEIFSSIQDLDVETRTYLEYAVNQNNQYRKILILPVHKTNYLNSIENNAISLLVPVKYSGSYLGDIVIDISIETIYQHLPGSKYYSESEFIFTSNANEILFINDVEKFKESNFTKLLDEVNKTIDNNVFIYDWNNEKSLVSITKSNLNLYNLITIIPYNQVFSTTENAPNSFLATLFIVSLSILLLAMALSTYFIDPILDLQDLMKEVEMGNFSVRISNVNGKDEIQNLKLSFNNMVKRLDEFFNVVTELKLKEAHLQIKEKEALIQALQSQINPHFLYNSLDIIKSIAYLENVPQIVDMSIGLADFYRYTAKNVSEEVTLRDEISYVKRYLSIIQVRFSKYFQSNIEVAEQYLNYNVVKLMIQPLVENSVKFAIEPNKGRGFIGIKVYDTNRKLIIEISDNGPGIPDEIRNQINNQLATITKEFKIEDINNHNLGISNVHARIVLKYGAEYGVVIGSKNSYGTKISIILPLLNNNI